MAANNFFNLAKTFTGFEVEKISQDQIGVFQYFKQLISWSLVRLQNDRNPTKHSLNLFSYGPITKSFNESPEAVFHIHWINNDTLSIDDFDLIPPGSLITLHDEWLYCGAEHYYNTGDSDLDFVSGYKRKKNGVRGIHWNYYTWEKKYAALANRQDLIFTVPSAWLYERAKKSLILRDAAVFILPNIIDTELFSPSEDAEKTKFRTSLGVGADEIIILFGAIDGDKNYLKGAGLLNDALALLGEKLTVSEKEKVRLVSFGGNKKEAGELNGFRMVSLGHIREKTMLRKVLSSGDFAVVPSLVESFGQVAAEALACGTPVVGFRNSGLLDIVKEDESGFFAEPFSVISLTEQMLRIIRLPAHQREVKGKVGRQYIVDNFSPKVVAKKYEKILDMAQALKRSSIS